MSKIISFKNSTFRKIYNSGSSFANRLLVIYYVKNGYDYNRIGISVSKKLGNSVIRSRIKRLIKESYRVNSFKIKQGYDIIFIARQNCNNANYKEICSAVLHLIKKKNLFDSIEKVNRITDC